jgi:hypothetical protein
MQLKTQQSAEDRHRQQIIFYAAKQAAIWQAVMSPLPFIKRTN